MSGAGTVINLDRIRGRLSYRWFSKAAEMLAAPDDREGFLRWLFCLLDGKKCFGSRMNAARAEEAMEQLLEDMGGSACLEKCPACGGELDFTGMDWLGPGRAEFGERCSGCGRNFNTTFAAVKWQEVER
jgi:hypothetical protein